jgi:3-oxoacyl-[acyl-carrier protein] reductase
MNLQGKTAIVTGASRGIGRAIAERLAKEGANLVVHYHQQADKAAEVVASAVETGARAVAVAGDVGSPGDVRALYQRALAEFGGVDIVVNNAAMVVGGPFVAIAEEAFDRIVAVNLRSVFISSQEAAKCLSDGGRVINVSAVLPSAAIAMIGAYGATKAGVEVLTRSLAHQLGSRGITVNAVAPGPTDTDMLAPDARANAAIIAGQTPLGRLGTAGDIAGVVAFLAGPDSAWITGQTINVNGGFQ